MTLDKLSSMSAATRAKPLFFGMHAAGESHRSLTLRQAFGNAPLGMTERGFVVILNGVKDLYIAIPAHIAL